MPPVVAPLGRALSNAPGRHLSGAAHQQLEVEPRLEHFVGNIHQLRIEVRLDLHTERQLGSHIAELHWDIGVQLDLPYMPAAAEGHPGAHSYTVAVRMDTSRVFLFICKEQLHINQQ